MTTWFTALLFGVGVATWIYVQFSRRSNNTKSSLIVAAIVGVIAFIVFFTAARLFLNS